MMFLTESYYFDKGNDFPLDKAVLITALSVSKFCDSYRAELLSPEKSVKEKIRKGILPKSEKERENLVKDVVRWIGDNSCVPHLFALFLYKDSKSKFDHHDDTCCWYLELEEKEFKYVQTDWKVNNLPEDLFYLSGKEKVIEERGKKIFGLIQVNSKRYYSPKQWEARKDKSSN